MFFFKKSFIFYYNVLYLVSIEGYANRRCDIVNSNENSHLFDDINKKHEDASFIREQKKRAKEIEKLKKDWKSILWERKRNRKETKEK